LIATSPSLVNMMIDDQIFMLRSVETQKDNHMDKYIKAGDSSRVFVVLMVVWAAENCLYNV